MVSYSRTSLFFVCNGLSFPPCLSVVSVRTEQRCACISDRRLTRQHRRSSASASVPDQERRIKRRQASVSCLRRPAANPGATRRQGEDAGGGGSRMARACFGSKAGPTWAQCGAHVILRRRWNEAGALARLHKFHFIFIFYFAHPKNFTLSQ